VLVLPRAVGWVGSAAVVVAIALVVALVIVATLVSPAEEHRA
jgi:hypothetical protein